MLDNIMTDGDILKHEMQAKTKHLIWRPLDIQRGAGGHWLNEGWEAGPPHAQREQPHHQLSLQCDFISGLSSREKPIPFWLSL